jgi:Tfp pilus assembly protein PilN
MSRLQRRMNIDFAPRGLRRSLYLAHPAAPLLAGLGLLLCVGAGVAGWKLVEQQRLREHQLRHIQERAAAISARPAEVARVAIPEAQAAFVNGAIMQLNLPWRELQDAVAAATPRSVALVAMEPDPRKRVLKLTAETKTSDDMVAYVAELKQQELFSGVVLTRHEINEQDPNRPLRFQLEATWVAR